MSTAPISVEGCRCPVCGKGRLEERIITDRFEYPASEKQTITIVAENVPVAVCTACHESSSGPEAAIIRHQAIGRALGLLSPEEICAIRERLGLSQEQFAELTGIDEESISQWERGRLLQNRAMDRYLRLLDRNHDNVRVLRELQSTVPRPEVTVGDVLDEAELDVFEYVVMPRFAEPRG